MLRRNLFVQVLLIVALLSASVGKAYGVTTPTFPSCVNPQGQVIASYDSGTHGVVGNTSAFTGKDSVYTLSGDTLMQCLCADSGEGIQTNWWKVSSLTEDEVNVLISQGWALIPNGSAWGLEAAPYLTKNSSFACTTNPGGPGDGLSDGRSSKAVGGASAGSVLGASTQAVLGLASTGNIVFILTVILTGFTLLGSGIALSFKKRK